MTTAFRIWFNSKQKRKKFFLEMKLKAGCKTYLELSIKLKIPVGRLRLYVNGARGIPKEEIDRWTREFPIKLHEQNYKVVDMRKFYSKISKKGIETLKRKYGLNWAEITGKRSMKKLRKTLEDPIIHKKWRQSLENSLKNKFGPDFYREMGRLGGRKSIATANKEELERRYKKMFRKSFRYKIKFNGKNYRSAKEVEVAKILVSNGIQFQYEKRLFGFYPDFFLNNKTIIEVVGLEWKPHIERTKDKIKLFADNGFTVVIYTYPNMAKYFENSFANIVKTENELINVLGYSRG